MDNTNTTTDGSNTAESDDDDLQALVERGKELICAIEDRLEDVDSIDSIDEPALTELEADLEGLCEVAEKLASILETLDLSELADSIEPDELLEVIETGDVPEAISEGDPEEAIDVSALLGAIDLVETWEATELVDLIEEGQELTDAVDDLDEDESTIGSAVSTVTDDGGGEGWLDTDFDLDAEDTLEDLDVDVLEDPKYVQVAIQQGAMKGIDGVRWALLEAHEKFEDLYEFNRERMRRQNKGTHSRNPTAVSSMPLDRADVPSTARHSTVPQQVRYSSAPSRRRIYGARFEAELEKLEDRKGGEDNGA